VGRVEGWMLVGNAGGYAAAFVNFC